MEESKSQSEMTYVMVRREGKNRALFKPQYTFWKYTADVLILFWKYCKNNF